MAEISKINISGVTYDIVDDTAVHSVSVNSSQSGGTQIGTVTIDGTTTVFYAPNATPPVQSNWTQETTTTLDYIKNKPAIWDSEDYKVPFGQTYGDSDTKAVGAVALNLITNQAKGDYSVSEGHQSNGNLDVVINGVTTTLPYGASGEASHAEGYDTIASGPSSHAEGYNTTASGFDAHAEGELTIASGTASHAEGEETKAYGTHSHAEGNKSTASGVEAHAEGSNTTASGSDSHAEGYYTTASGGYSHAEGSYSTASGVYSHAEGYYSIAQRKSQHVFGEYNNADATGTTTSRGTYVEIVGNGSGTSNRSNARTLDWNGNEVLAGKLTVGITPTANMDVTTKQYVDNAIAGIASDTKVQQNAAITTAGNYPVMLGYSTATSEVTNTLNKTALLHYNPSTKLLQTGALGVTATTGYTNTVPTAAGVDGQVMFVLVD